MRSCVVTGIGWVTCLGHEPSTVSDRLRRLQHGIVPFQPFLDDPQIPVKVAAPLQGFDTASADQEDWTFPGTLRFRLEQLRALSPNALYAQFALHQAIQEAGLTASEISSDRTGLFTASSGSANQTYANMDKMKRVGPMRCSPLGIVASIAGTLNFNLAAAFHIKGSSCGFVSACASSGHALGYALDAIQLGRQDRALVVGAEDFAVETIAPFAGMRVLSTNSDPDTASRPFDRQRDGFVGTGGSVALILEEEESARQRNARIYGRFSGWAQSTDGYHIAASHPDGEGLARAMRLVMGQLGWHPRDVDYVNAHATSTQAGDISECRALRTVFGESNPSPAISSTKALTGHALSLSSIMEAAFCLLAHRDGFVPGSAHITELDEEAAGLNIIRETVHSPAQKWLSNSSGFGGANVVLAFEAL
jgi:3-oxoacyl-[acyl-carrier-protein] synthase-1